MELSMGERKAVTNKMAAAYRRGTKAEKSAVLDQLVELTGWHRDHARAQLRGAGEIRVVRVRRPRTPVYSARVISALELCWRVGRRPGRQAPGPDARLARPAACAETASSTSPSTKPGCSVP